MKTKLLKKIRKQWSITKITDTKFIPSYINEKDFERLGYCYYRVEFRASLSSWGKLKDNTFKTEQACRDHILCWVRYEYEQKMKPRVKKEEKVWYVHKT